MAGSARTEHGGGSTQVADFDDQMWPVTCAILVLAGFVVGIILANSDFHDGRLLYDGRTHLAIVAALVLLTFAGAFCLQGKIRRRLQLCILLSLIAHLSGALVVYCYPVTLPIVAERGDEGRTIPPDEELIAPDYHWEQAEEPDADQAFEGPVRTVAQDEMPPAATVEPPDPQRIAPVAEIPRAPAVGETPLGPSASDSENRVALPAPPLVASRQVEPIADLAMNRRFVRVVEMPHPEDAASVPPPEAAKRPPVEPQFASVESRKAEAEVPPPAAAMSRPAAEAGQAMPAQTPAPRLPSAAAVRSEASPPAGPREGDLPGQPRTLARAELGGLALPSSVLPNEGERSPAPAAAGGQPGSQLEAASDVAVERTARSRAPAGPRIAAAGTQDLGVGAALLVARSGVPGGTGAGRPAIAGRSGEEEGLPRAGALGSFSDRGVPLPAAAARRAKASQPGGGGAALSPGVAATLPRTQIAGGSELPTAVLPSEGANLAGAGGVSAARGGGTSRLDAGEIASVRQSTAPGAAPARGAGAAGPLDFGAGSALAAPPDIAAGGGRGIVAANPAIIGNLRRRNVDESNAASGFARAAAGTPYLPGGAAEAALALPPVQPAGTRTAAGPLEAGAGRNMVEVAMADTGPADISAMGRSRASPTAGGEDPAGALERGGSPSPQAPSAAGRGRSDINPDDLAGGLGPVAVARSGGPLVLEGTVKEPTEFYKRRGEIRHGLGYGGAEGAGFTEPAVEAGLRFFTSLQFPDGHWSLDRLPEGMRLDDAALGQMPADSAATGLVLLSYLGAGYTHLDEKYRDVVQRGVEWLVKHQKADGDLFTGGEEHTHFYGHGIAAMALCEAYGMTQDPELREPARKAVEYIVKTQDPRHGGWRYVPGKGESDTSVTGWQLMALKSAQMAGLEIPQETLDGIRRWLNQAEAPERDGRYMYSPWEGDTPQERAGRVPSLAMTSEAMLMRMYLGRRRDDAQLIRGAEYLAAHLPEVGTREQPTRDCYYWYYATQAMYQMQGPYWAAWQARLNPLLKAGQVRDGPLAGSWHPLEPVKDVYGNAGRVYVTAMNLLMLEVYYRHLPLFQELSK
jgi:hypothetical protein